MNFAQSNRTVLYLLTGLVTGIVLGLTFLAWSQAIKGAIGIYDVFPVLGLTAYVLMWTHYVSGSLKRLLGLEKTDALNAFFAVTAYLVLALILLHPGLLYSGLFQDGFGLPPLSSLQVYTDGAARIGIFLGGTALVFFLLFEFKRWFADRTWWRYIEYLSIVGMGLIFMHGLMLGGELLNGWYRSVWILLGAVLAVCILYNYSYDAKANKGDHDGIKH